MHFSMNAISLGVVFLVPLGLGNHLRMSLL